MLQALKPLALRAELQLSQKPCLEGRVHLPHEPVEHHQRLEGHEPPTLILKTLGQPMDDVGHLGKGGHMLSWYDTWKLLTLDTS